MQLLLIISLYLLTVFIASGMLWVLYLCVMCLKRAKDLNFNIKTAYEPNAREITIYEEKGK